MRSLRGQHRRHRRRGLPADPAVSGGPSFTIPRRLLKEAINEVVFAAAPDDTRPVLAGVLLKMGGGELTLAAADGFRLAVRTVELPEGGPELQMIVPAKTLTEVARLLSDDADEQVAINTTPNGNQVYFAFGKTEITSRLIEGQFPDYQRIIPPEAKTKVKLSARPIFCAPRAPRPSSPATTRISCAWSAARPKTTPSSPLGSVLVKSTSAEMGDNEGTLDATVDGDDTQIAFNGRYLRDALEAIDTPEVLLQITGPSSPGHHQPRRRAERVPARDHADACSKMKVSSASLSS